MAEDQAPTDLALPLLQWRPFVPTEQSTSTRLMLAPTQREDSMAPLAECVAVGPEHGAKTSRIMDLPTEIRLRIYHFVFIYERPICPRLRGDTLQRPEDYRFFDGHLSLGPILASPFAIKATCRKIRSEIGQSWISFYKDNTFDFSHSPQDLIDFLNFCNAHGVVHLLNHIIITVPTEDPMVAFGHWSDLTSYPLEFWPEQPAFRILKALVVLGELRPTNRNEAGRVVSFDRTMTVEAPGLDLSLPGHFHLNWLSIRLENYGGYVGPILKLRGDDAGRKVHDKELPFMTLHWNWEKQEPAVRTYTRSGYVHDWPVDPSMFLIHSANDEEDLGQEHRDQGDRDGDLGSYPPRDMPDVCWTELPFAKKPYPLLMTPHQNPMITQKDVEAFWNRPNRDSIVLPTAGGGSVAFAKAAPSLRELRDRVYRSVCVPFGHTKGFGRCPCGCGNVEPEEPEELRWEVLEERVRNPDALDLVMMRLRGRDH